MGEWTAPVTLADIERASERIAPYLVQTPLLQLPELSSEIGRNVYVKCENLQRTGAFKARGALNALLQLASGPVKPQGVITASSGNHGQAVAFAAQLLRFPCVVVVPETVLAGKERAIIGYGAEVIRCGTTSSARIELAERLAKERGLVFVPPYDHADIIAGQGTVGLELMKQQPDVDTVIVPVGGGGLLSGIATAVKNIRPNARVFAAEPELANDTYLSFQRGEPVDIGETKTIADGLRTSHPGSLTFPIVRHYVDQVLPVTEHGIVDAVIHLLDRSKLLVEPSGATSVAAVREHTRVQQGTGSIVCVLSGGNADLQALAAWLAERT